MAPKRELNRRNRETLERIFGRPTVADMRWEDLVRLIKALGGLVSEGAGSRVRFALRNEGNGDLAVMTLDKPHGKRGKDMRKYQVEDAREFLMRAGHQPDDE